MRFKVDWTNVQEASERPGEGAYVLKIIDAKEVYPEYVEIVYDVAEGPFEGYYSDEWGRSNAWSHSARVYYKGNAKGIFKHFLSCLEQSNPFFDIAKWQESASEQSFVGLYVGGILRKRLYTGADGTDKEAIELGKFVTAAEVRAGSCDLMPPRDQRKAQAAKPAYNPYEENLPF